MDTGTIAIFMVLVSILCMCLTIGIGVFVGGTLMAFCNAASHRDNIRYPDDKEREWGN